MSLQNDICDVCMEQVPLFARVYDSGFSDVKRNELVCKECWKVLRDDPQWSFELLKDDYNLIRCDYQECGKPAIVVRRNIRAQELFTMCCDCREMTLWHFNWEHVGWLDEQGNDLLRENTEVA